MNAVALSRRTFLLVSSTLAASALGCRRQAKSAGRQVRRVVSLTPNTTETLFALGAGALVVGRSRYCDYPQEALKLPVVGGYVDPSYEAILGLRPDLVTGARGPTGSGLSERLEARGIQTFFPPTESVAEILAMIIGLGRLLGRQEQGAALDEKIRGQLARTDQRVRDRKPPRLLLVFGLAPIVVAGPGSFPDEMIRLAGGANAIERGGHYPTVGIETVLGANPELIIDAAVAEGHGTDRITVEQPGWSTVGAVRQGRVAAINTNTVLRPGPRVGEGVEALAALIHPQ